MTVFLVALCALWTLCFEGGIVLILVCLGLPWGLGALLALPLALAFALGTWGLLVTKVRPLIAPPRPPKHPFEESPGPPHPTTR